MDAWSLAMKEASNHEFESNDILFQSLIERVERVESKAKRSEDQIETLERRLLIAERRISPFENSGILWRRIGKEEGGSVENCEEGDFRDFDVKPEEEYQLPMDVYTIVASWKFNSRPFWISLLVVVVQFVLLSLLLVDQVQGSGESDLIVFPANVPTIVHVAQALATVIAITDSIVIF